MQVEEAVIEVVPEETKEPTDTKPELLDTSDDKGKEDTPKEEDTEEKKVETISPPSTSSSSKVVAKEIVSIGKDKMLDFYDNTANYLIQKNHSHIN